MENPHPPSCSSHMTMVVKPLLILSCCLVIVLAIVGVVMAGSPETALALFISILGLATLCAGIMLGDKLIRGAGHTKYQVSSQEFKRS